MRVCVTQTQGAPKMVGVLLMSLQKPPKGGVPNKNDAQVSPLHGSPFLSSGHAVL